MDAQSIRDKRQQHSEMRERDFARIHKISEAELVAAFVGHGNTRLTLDVPGILKAIPGLGEVMALTRNESCVHEKIGLYGNVNVGPEVGIVHLDEIDLRVFPKKWASVFAVQKPDKDDVRRSIQFFDAAGEAVHKIHLRPASDIPAYAALVELFRAPEQPDTLSVELAEPRVTMGNSGSRDDLHKEWRALQDTHQFFGMLRKLNLQRQEALRMADPDLAWKLDLTGIETMLAGAVEHKLPIMAFVGNQGCIQIHSGPVQNIQTMGPWLNIFDETFHMHLRLDQIAELWGVRKPTRDGHVTSLEAYAEDGTLIIQFFGVRQEGVDERAQWRSLAESLPHLAIAAPRQAVLT